jgi:hypothetical protein
MIVILYVYFTENSTANGTVPAGFGLAFTLISPTTAARL